jgi:hypothetical protein
LTQATPSPVWWHFFNDDMMVGSSLTLLAMHVRWSRVKVINSLHTWLVTK